MQMKEKPGLLESQRGKDLAQAMLAVAILALIAIFVTLYR